MKACKHPSCTYPVFSHLYCKSHQYLRTDSGYLKKQAIAKEKKYHPVKKVMRNMDFGFSGEAEMFDSIWDQTPFHFCEFTGESLDLFYGTDLYYSCFMHILSKKQFPLFKLNSKNIRLGYPMFHTIVDQGTKDDRLEHPTWDFDKWDRLVQEMKEEYINFKKKNLLA